jgi:carbamoyltransferase
MIAPRLALGLHVGHDRAVSIVKDGELIGHLAQERIDRTKGSDSHSLPLQALVALLNFLRLEIANFGAVGISYASSEHPGRLTDRWRDELHEGGLGAFHTIIPVPHHLSHAFSALHTSPFDNALVLVADGGGDIVDSRLEAESLYLAHQGELRLVEQRLQDFPSAQLRHLGGHAFDALNPTDFDKQISLGRKYTQISYNLGFAPGQDGKTMALAPFGRTLVDYPENVAGIKFDLRYRDVLVEIEEFWRKTGLSLGAFKRKFRADIAATAQSVLERILIPLVDDCAREHHQTTLCLAGGVFLNCVLNHKILEHTAIRHIHIVPASGDDGQSIGAAFFAYKMTFGAHPRSLSFNPYLGIEYDDDEIVAALAEFDLTAPFLTDDRLAFELANRLSKGEIIGIVRGRSELGPRALCHRSLLGDPRSLATKAKLDKLIKHREAFRPYAPVVKEEAQFRFFELEQSSPFMLLAASVKPEYQTKLPAITHVDGSARVQAVGSHSEPFIHATLTAFETLTGFPVLLNTSLNDAGEPTVETPRDALATFLGTAIDVLVLGNRLLLKCSLEERQPIPA